jgi:zinc protease
MAHAIDLKPIANPLGIKAWLVEEHTRSTVAMAIDFAGGSSQDPAARRGLTNLMVGLLNYDGVGDLDSAAYQARQEAQSIQIGWEFDRDSLWGIVIMPGQNRAEAARLTNLALTAPRYDTEVVERIREAILMGVTNRSPNSEGLLAFMAALYPGHIYGIWEAGNANSLTAATVADLRAYRQKVMALDNLTVVVVGDVDAAGAATLVADAFRGLPEKAQLVAIPDPTPPAAKRIDTVAAVTQTSIRFGGPAIKRSDVDYAAAMAAAYIAGNRGAGFRLFDALVTRERLTTAVSLTLNETWHAAWFAGNMNTRPDQTNAAIAAVERELKRFAEEGPTVEEVARAQEYLVTSFVSRFDSRAGAAVELVNELSAGFGTDYSDRYVGQVLSLTRADVKRAAERMFGSGLVVYTVAPATP